MKTATSYSTLVLILSLGLSLSSQVRAKDAAKPSQSQKAIPKTKPAASKERKVNIVIETSEGTIKAELFSDKAPITVKNFTNYIDKKFYDGLVFHRVIDNFMIQGGGFNEKLQLKPTDAAITNEANNGLTNQKGTFAMARTPDPHSASSQFFINLKDNDFLNFKRPAGADYGYAVFGKVTDGMDVVEKIAKVPTTSQNSMRDVPAKPVIIKSIRKSEAKQK